ncbi:type VII toxin-antitoxin system HepT family RNase toxin [Thermodesulfitimonas autotrophica]|uniref:type VII toxin-antitoxin system HepT family RNase toxin n=1 Tax=Thermodesulfitimonas autotrophica TaxID=1894989 RepID=UPI002FE38614
MVDKELLAEKLRLLSEYITDLEEQKTISLTDLKENKLLRRYVERTLHLAVEACLDIGNHIIADLNLREPADYKDVLAVLTEAGYLPSAKLADFKKMAQFRNVIVRDYARIEPEILYAILQKNIADLRLFARAIRDSFLQE